MTTLCSNQNNHLESTNAISLSSPWDLSIYNNILYIAMAGKHQIWSYDISLDAIFYADYDKNRDTQKKSHFMFFCVGCTLCRKRLPS